MDYFDNIWPSSAGQRAQIQTYFGAANKSSSNATNSWELNIFESLKIKFTKLNKLVKLPEKQGQ